MSSTEQESLLRYGAVEVMRTDDDATAAAQTYFDAPIDDLLLRSQIVGADPADADADADGAAGAPPPPIELLPPLLAADQPRRVWRRGRSGRNPAATTKW